MSLKLYIDHLSQPSRAVHMFCLLNKIPFEIKETRLGRGDHKLPEFLEKINPIGQVPAIMDGSKSLFESHTILRYLARTRKVPDQFYPSDILKSTEVDKYLDWHHTNLRRLAPYVHLVKWPDHFVEETKGSEEAIVTLRESHHKRILLSLERIENYFLKSPKKHLANDELSIADIVCACELSQLHFIEYRLKSYKNIRNWYKPISSMPEFQESHRVMFDFIKKNYNFHPLF